MHAGLYFVAMRNSFMSVTVVLFLASKNKMGMGGQWKLPQGW